MDLVLPGALFIDTATQKRREKKSATHPTDRSKHERRLFCAACRNPITHQDERISVHGGHAHTGTNPAGYTFHIGCFREAAGCATQGWASLEHTWFPGYAWQIAICARCGAQLGWRYQGSADRFYGLILDRLTSIAGRAG
jgi:hypothetical protein